VDGQVEIYPTAEVLPSNLLRIFVYFPRRWCQTNTNGSPKSRRATSSSQQLTPLGKCRVAEVLEAGAAFE
jgi:hypothetical protein